MNLLIKNIAMITALCFCLPATAQEHLLTMIMRTICMTNTITKRLIQAMPLTVATPLVMDRF